MAELGGETNKLVVATANRLRLVQTDLADEQPEVRQQYLADEVERALAKVVPAERPAFLQALQDWFPTWQRVDVGPRAEESMSQSAADQRDLKDASFLVERLIELAPSMTEQERKGVADRLRDAGLSAEGRQAWPQQAADKLHAHLKLSQDADVDPLRSLELLQMQVDFALSLEQLVWSTWKAISPRSEIRGSGDLKKSLGPFLLGSQDVPRGEVMMHLEKLRQLTASLISAVSQTGRQFSQSYYAKFSPEMIEESAKRDKKALESIGVAAWRKYREVYGTTDQATIEREIMQLIAGYAEKLMKGLSR